MVVAGGARGGCTDRVKGVTGLLVAGPDDGETTEMGWWWAGVGIDTGKGGTGVLVAGPVRGESNKFGVVVRGGGGGEETG